MWDKKPSGRFFLIALSGTENMVSLNQMASPLLDSLHYAFSTFYWEIAINKSVEKIWQEGESNKRIMKFSTRMYPKDNKEEEPLQFKNIATELYSLFCWIHCPVQQIG